MSMRFAGAQIEECLSVRAAVPAEWLSRVKLLDLLCLGHQVDCHFLVTARSGHIRAATRKEDACMGRGPKIICDFRNHDRSLAKCGERRRGLSRRQSFRPRAVVYSRTAGQALLRCAKSLFAGANVCRSQWEIASESACATKRECALRTFRPRAAA